MSGKITMCTQFQFHKGTIRTFGDTMRCMMQDNFNSIKVRLERKAVYGIDTIFQFQFHKGTIRTFFASQLQAKSEISIP